MRDGASVYYSKLRVACSVFSACHSSLERAVAVFAKYCQSRGRVWPVSAASASPGLPGSGGCLRPQPLPPPASQKLPRMAITEGRAGRWRQALSLLREVHESGLKPNVITYSAAIQACAEGGQDEHALRLFTDIEKSQALQANYVTFNAVLDAVCSADRRRARAPPSPPLA